MRAIVCPRYGGPDVLELREMERPSPKDDEVCIRVMATAVTASDIFIRGRDTHPVPDPDALDARA